MSALKNVKDVNVLVAFDQIDCMYGMTRYHDTQSQLLHANNFLLTNEIVKVVDEGLGDSARVMSIDMQGPHVTTFLENARENAQCIVITILKISIIINYFSWWIPNFSNDFKWDWYYATTNERE